MADKKDYSILEEDLKYEFRNPIFKRAHGSVP
jgi:hypothetical protein